jgi:hypothetical protein
MKNNILTHSNCLAYYYAGDCNNYLIDIYARNQPIDLGALIRTWHQVWDLEPDYSILGYVWGMTTPGMSLEIEYQNFGPTDIRYTTVIFPYLTESIPVIYS